MPVLSRRNAGKLLRVVKGEPHARPEDHEEGVATGDEDAPAISTHTMPRSAGAPSQLPPPGRTRLSASPMSSEDEPSSPRKAHPCAEDAPRARKATRAPDKAARKMPPRKASHKIIQAPQAGAYAGGKAAKDRWKKRDSEDKASVSRIAGVARPGSTGKRVAVERSDQQESASDIFGMGDSSAPKRRRVAAATTTMNMFAPAVRKTFGKGHSVAGRSSAHVTTRTHTATPKDRFKHLQDYAAQDASKKGAKDSGSESESSVDMLPVPIKKPPLRKHNNSEARKRDNENELPPLQGRDTKRPNLGDLLGDYGHGTELSSQLSMEDPSASQRDAAGETAPSSSAGDVSQEIVEDTSAAPRCPLCQTTVEQAHYDTFWTSLTKRTVRQQTLFCHEHRKREAVSRYEAEGYPHIDWGALPSRVLRNRDRLQGIIDGNPEYASPHRDYLVAKMAAGERKNWKKDLAVGACEDSQTGYYGSRGRRLIMETITSSLGAHLEKAASHDAVIRHWGISEFTIGALVPETAVALICEDFGVQQGVARGILKESAECGALVNDEIDDIVDVASSEEEDDCGGDEDKT